MWAQEKDKLYIDLIFNLDFTVVELPVDFSKINHNSLTWETLNQIPEALEVLRA